MKKPKKPDKDQAERFKETARQVEADESGEAFRQAMETILPPKKKDSP